MPNLPQCQTVISQFLDLYPSGSRLVGLCPFHNDKDTLSLTVYPETDSWYCFGCDRGGGVLQFLMARGMTHNQAIEWCNLRKGNPPKPKFKPQFKVHKGLQRVDCSVVDYWHTLLRDRREYFKSRLFTDETIDKFKLGWTGQRFSIPFWRGEPGNSKVLAVQSRRNGTKGPKYKWELGTQPHIFGLQSIQNDGICIIFFSTLDALLAIQDGIAAISVPGQTVGQSSAHCWEELSSKLGDILGFRDMVIVPDRGEEYMGYRLAHKLNCRVFEWPEGPFTDYCEFRFENSVDVFKEMMST